MVYLLIYRDTCKNPNKVLCFTRSSPLIYQLPAQYPSSVLTELEDVKQTLKDLVFYNLDQLVVCKLSRITSQTAIQELLEEFVHSDVTKVCVIVANMQETSIQVVNHLRIIIEETEALAPQKQKLFILLIHFLPNQFFKPCYPSLFLKGWDHFYLDTIAHSTVKGVIDIKDWFLLCYSQDLQQHHQEDMLIKALSDMIPQAIPILSSRVFFGANKDSSFNAPMNGSKRSEALRELLFDHGVGKVLCERFCSYWKPSVMAEYLHKTASFNRSRESTLNITDSIQSLFKSHFFDFLVYMISQINDQFNIDILFGSNTSPAIKKLFLDILQVFPLPALSQLNVLSTNLQAPQHVAYVPRFPFFNLTSSLMEQHIDQCQKETNIKLDILSDDKEESIRFNVRKSVMESLREAVLKNIRDHMNVSDYEIQNLYI